MKLQATIESEKLSRIIGKASDESLTVDFTVKNTKVCKVIFTEEKLIVLNRAGKTIHVVKIENL